MPDTLDIKSNFNFAAEYKTYLVSALLQVIS